MGGEDGIAITKLDNGNYLLKAADNEIAFLVNEKHIGHSTASIAAYYLYPSLMVHHRPPSLFIPY